MRKRHLLPYLLLAVVFLSLLFTLNSCKKDNNKQSNSPLAEAAIATPTKLGLYEADSSIYKLLYIAVPQIGTKTLSEDFNALVFDTGSGGMVIDASEVLPQSMITSSGINFTGDSTVIDGITITNQTSIVEYGADAASTDKVYGNLAYASVTVGDRDGSIVIKRLPFFLYYKAVDGNGKKYDQGEFDVFGVDPEYDVTFPNKAYITSPFSYFDPGNGLTNGFKMAALGTNNFSVNGTFVPGVITLGLTANDLSASSGFVMNQLSFENGIGYSPVVPVTVSYNNKTISTDAVFDSGTEPYSYIEDKTASGTVTLLPANTPVSITSGSGFNYAYTISATDNLTYIENPQKSGGEESIISLEFFLNNEYLLDYTNHRLGLKNN